METLNDYLLRMLDAGEGELGEALRDADQLADWPEHLRLQRMKLRRYYRRGNASPKATSHRVANVRRNNGC